MLTRLSLEVDRAIDNLMKSGKFPMMGFPGPGPGPRRDPVPLMTGRAYQDFGKASRSVGAQLDANHSTRSSRWPHATTRFHG